MALYYILKNIRITNNLAYLFRGFYFEKNISTKCNQAEKNPRVYGTNEYPGGKSNPAKEESKGQKKISRLKLKNNRFSKNERLKTSFEFRKIKRKNHLYFKQGPIKIYILKQNLEYSRLGIIIYKKAGKAFYRNKVKRWVREIFRVSKSGFKKKRDIVFVIGRGTELVDFKFLQESFFTALQKYQE